MTPGHDLRIVAAMKATHPLEKRMAAMSYGQIILVETPKQRDAAHRIALRRGLNIKTQKVIRGKGYEILRKP